MRLAESLNADFGGTNLSGQLNYIFQTPLSDKNKLRRHCAANLIGVPDIEPEQSTMLMFSSWEMEL